MNTYTQKPTRLRIVFLASLLLFSSVASSTLVDFSNYTQSSETSLDWLDLTESINMNIGTALSQNIGWRQATRIDLNSLLASEYGINNAITSPLNSTIPELIPHAGDLLSHFGVTSPNSGTSSFGFYDNDLSGPNPYHYLGFSITGPGNNGSFSTSSTAFTNAGHFLVRDTPAIVPVPAAFWLFTSGLIGFMGYARRT